MIISQTPYRVSLAGGGTDLPAFYRQEAGAVVSVTIGRHIYVTVHSRFKPNVRVAYSRTETVDRYDDLDHELARETLRLLDLDVPLEITTIGDVPAGTGMGSSSSLSVGLLNALYAYRGEIVSHERLAREGCQVEIDILGKPIGKQDQYAAAFGGINYMVFHADDTVDVEPIPFRAEMLATLESYALLVYTNDQRDANEILKQQSDGTNNCMSDLRQIRDLAGNIRTTLSGDGDINELADLLHEGWQLKRSLKFGISNKKIDHWYETARRAGALGGKLLGAGGGGFMLLLAPPECHESIREALGRPHELPFTVDPRGSRIVFISDDHAPQSTASQTARGLCSAVHNQ